MPPKRSQAKDTARTANHPYKLRSLRNRAHAGTIALDRPAEKVKHNKALREQALQVLNKKELRKFPMEQLRRLATIKKVHGRRKQSIMMSLKRIYGEAVPLYPSEGRVEMREHSREEYQIGHRRVVRVETYQEVIFKEEEVEDTSILEDPPEPRRSDRLRQKAQLTGTDCLVFKIPSKIG
ncbi:hypothetical protein P691DRAFT_757234 [Macrolepiota fuliginosa MF-IS2]|uniref:Uncharacterized protein n=1 Tax=Macrolepiota fuliginosa MF-IS2 TaxID=1400762 RepID=A0A9P6C492_9AGAR|nr:hypothetical protein P691DRAFT_757234 [Macrolepiota fuliginosa MF-IS2]